RDDGTGGRPTPRSQRPRLLAALLPLLALAALAQAPAHAAPKSINGFVGGGAGINSGGLFTQPRDVAVYTAGDSDPANDKILVVEGLGNNSRVQRLDRHGNFELIWGKDVVRAGAPGNLGTGFEICSEAVGGAESCKSAPTGAAEGEFDNPGGIAVDQSTGHVYVHDRNNLRVQEFTLDGEFVRAWGWGVATGAAELEVCTANCRKGLAGGGDGQLGDTGVTGAGIAVDPVNGDVFVADPANRRAQQFSATGAFVAKFGVAGGGVGEFGSSSPSRIAVDSSHVVYLSDTNASDRVQRYDSVADVFLAPIECCAPTVGAPLAAGATVGIEVAADGDGPGPDREALLVARDPASGPAVVQELDIPTPPTDPVTAVVDTHTYADEFISGIAHSDTDGHVYVTVPGLFSPPNGPFAFPCPLSAAGTFVCSGLVALAESAGVVSAQLVDPPSRVGSTSLAVTGSVNPAGGVARYRFEVSTDGSEWRDTGVGGYAAGTADVEAPGELSALQPATPYKVRLRAEKHTSITTVQSASSNEVTTVTAIAPPDVSTRRAVYVTDTSAELRARIDPNGIETTYRFEYGLAGGPLDRQVPLTDAGAGTGNDPQLFVEDLAGLEPATAYAFRIVATNAAGESVGATVAFETRELDDVYAPPGRGYELVSPADKVAGVGTGVWYNGPAAIEEVGFGAHRGERFAAKGTLGATLLDGPYAYANDWALAERTDSGWKSGPGASRRAYGSQHKTFMTMSSATPDLSTMGWTSNGHTVKPFPEMEPWEETRVGNVLLLRRWAGGEWELFGPLAEGHVTDNQPELSEAVAEDGTAVAATALRVRGLAGAGDPTSPAFDDLVEGSNVYVDETPGAFSDVFPGDDGVRELVNVCTAGTVLPTRVQAGAFFKQGTAACPDALAGRDSRLVSPYGASLGTDKEGVISADGSRVFFMAPDVRVPQSTAGCSGVGADTVCPTQLYVRQRSSDGSVVTRWISRTQVTAANGAAADQDASLIGPAFFEGASADGDKVFFRTNSPLTADDPNGLGSAPAGGVTTGDAHGESWDLYMYDMPDGQDADPAGGELVRISRGPGGQGDCNSPFGGAGSDRPGALRFVSADGARAFFTCAAPLPGVADPGSGTITDPTGARDTAATSNLYVYDAGRSGADRWRFVALLPRTSPLGACATRSAELGSTLYGSGNDVNLSNVGSCVSGTADGAFVTFFTDGALTIDDPDDGVGDVYGYSATRDQLHRLSKAQGGAGGAYPCRPQTPAPMCHGDGGIGPERMPVKRLGVASEPTNQTDRIAYFQSRSQLVAEDTDDAYDVYEWRNGDLTLLSTGQSPTDGAFYVGNDATGRNVFMATRDRLSWEDSDAVLDVYSARAGGGFDRPPVHRPCDVLGDGCQGTGGSAVGPPIGSDAPGGSNAKPQRRIALTLRTHLSRRARQLAARRGVVPVRVRVSGPTLVRVAARAPVGGRLRRAGTARKRVHKAGTVTVRLRVRGQARRRLRSGRAVRLRLVVRAKGAVPEKVTIVLKRGRR
ncbi:MAG TPA: hypothetical protein VHF88_04245, partial [Thermoleophilaceae bacterium]|nr:hypothetical protein [Thermoleophilaceae bacterium]